MTQIYLIRHAEAEGNLYRRAHGHYDGQITKRGHKQIELLQKRFENEQIDAVYSSDLTRARVTSASIHAPRGLEVSATNRLREVNIGEWEDMPWGEIERVHGEMCKHFNSDPARWDVSDCEPYLSVQKRITDFITDLAQKHEGKSVAAFSHGFAIRSFLCGQLGYASDEVTNVPYCDNTAVALIIWENDKLTLKYHGDNSHLTTEDSTFAHQTWWRGGKVNENLHYKLSSEDSAQRAQFIASGGSINVAPVEFEAFLDDEPIGALGLDPNKDKDAGFVEYIYVKPELRRSGFGIQLVGQAISEYRKMGHNKLRIKADTADTLDFGMKYGFEKVSDSVMEKDISRNII